MNDPIRGVLAGFVATLVISMLMLLRLSMGLMTWFNPIEIMNLNAQTLFGTPDTIAVGWVIHFAVGMIVWGSLFVLLEPRIPVKTYTRRGLLFGAAAWLLVMLTVFPLAGSGVFALGLGFVITLLTLVSHLIFGAVMGATYGWLKTIEPGSRSGLVPH